MMKTVQVVYVLYTVRIPIRHFRQEVVLICGNIGKSKDV